MQVPYPWQQQAWSQFVQIEASGRLPHGLILGGPQGIGKLALARHLAHFLMCLQRQPDAACGQCKSCLLVAADTHPDIREFCPEGDSKVLKVDQIRELNDFLAKTPQQGRRKIAILHPAESMNLNAANALLKTLEEPSADASLILVSHMPGQLLPTIRSRCQVQQLNLPAPETVIPWLTGQVDAQIDVQALLRFANGSPLAALAMAQDGQLEQRKTMLADLALVLKRQQSPFEVAARWHKLDLERSLTWLYQWCADVIAFQASGDLQHIADVSAQKMLAYVAEKANPVRLHHFLDELNDALRMLRQRQNPNAQLLLEMLLARWLELIAKRPLRA